MEFLNTTNAAAGWTMGFDRSGREVVIVAIKASFAIPPPGEAPALLEEQVPVVTADSFTGEPGLTAPVYESDYAHHRPMCDVLINASAYAPEGKPVRRLGIGVRAGAMAKAFAVVGPRVWRSGATGIRAGKPESFEIMPLTYDVAFGGVEVDPGDPEKALALAANPVGRGYLPFKERPDGRPMPNTEELERPVVDVSESYRPMALGPIGRNWQPRVAYAGTYDQGWLDHRAPFWPDDFDYRYFQAASPDQQIPYPEGGEEIALRNLTPDGIVVFHLPALAMPVWFLPYRGRDRRVNSVIDTLIVEPDLGRFSMVWRAALPMRQSCFDIKQIIVGEMSEAWQRVRKYGNKTYYRGLAELVRAKKGL